MKIILEILGFYLVIIGTWRLANSTVRSPVGADLWTFKESEDNYNPILDLLSIHKVFIWILSTIKSFNKKGQLTGAAILHKQFNWGLLWLLLGIMLQFSAQFIK